MDENDPQTPPELVDQGADEPADGAEPTEWQHPAGKGGGPDSGDVDKYGGAIPGEHPPVELGERPHEILPGVDKHAVKVGTDEQGNDVYAHHDAHGARFSI